MSVLGAGNYVKAGDNLIVMSAMKMETTISAPCSGLIQHVAVAQGEQLDAGDLVVLIKEGEVDPSAAPASVPETVTA